MDTTLLWSQGLALMLSATALYVAVNRRAGRFQSIGNAVLYVLIALTFSYLCIAAWGASYFAPDGGPLFFASLAALFLAGAAALQIFGSRPAAPGLHQRALAWNWKWLLGIFVVTAALESIAFYNFKIATEQRISADLEKARAFAQLYNPPIPDAINSAQPESLAFDLLVRSSDKAAAQIDQIRKPASLDLTPLTQPELIAAVANNRRPLALAYVAASRAGYFSLEENLAFPWSLNSDRADKVTLLEIDSRERDKREIGRGKSRMRLAELLGARAVQRAAANERTAAAQDLTVLWKLERFHNLGTLPMHALELAFQTSGWTAAELQAIEIPESARMVEQLNRTLANAESQWSVFGILGSQAAVEPDSLIRNSLQQLFTPTRDPLDSVFGFILTLSGEQELRRSHQLLDHLWQVAYLPPAERTAALHSEHSAGSYETRWTREAMARTLTRETRRRLSRAAVAFLQHRAAAGKDVSTLNQLVPDQLDAVPEDPYDGQPLKLAISAGEVVIYSVGPDGKDDRGKPLDGPGNIDEPGDISFRLPVR